MRQLIDLFDSKHFGALFTGTVALGTFEGGIHDWRLLAVPVMCVVCFYASFR
jgi:hypothetical protein